MIKKISLALLVITGFIIACSTSSSEKVDQPGVSQAASGQIVWAKFDDGLKNVSTTNKHVLAYFWRDG